MRHGSPGQTASRDLRRSRKRLAELRPEALHCKHCDTRVPDVHTMDTTGMEGIEAAFAGVCANCMRTIWWLKGNPEAVAMTKVAIEDSAGDSGVAG